MNEVFSATRMWKLLRYEVVNYMPRFFKVVLILASVLVAFWLFCLVSPDIYNFCGYSRCRFIEAFFTVAVVLSPFIIYKDMNNRKKGYMYAMIPASTIEKLLSMVAVCLVAVPLVAYVALTATDLLLYLLSNLGIGKFSNIEFYNPFASSFGTMGLMYYNMGLHGIHFGDVLLSFVTPVLPAIMFNTIFRKNKILKTILFNMSVSFFIVITVVLMMNNMPQLWESLYNFFTPEWSSMTDEEIVSWCLMLARVWSIVLVSVCLAITYYRIKKVNY